MCIPRNHSYDRWVPWCYPYLGSGPPPPNATDPWSNAQAVGILPGGSFQIPNHPNSYDFFFHDMNDLVGKIHSHW
ncbi:MAG: hypothetical protein MJD61_10545 [Proteobacteria bacterium]|nr:hypothetical protein [Pseudomonadota bacterium]